MGLPPRDVVRRIVHKLPIERSCECSTALQSALITEPELIPEKTRENLSILIDKYLDRPSGE